MSRRSLVIAIIAFIVLRGVLVWLAVSPERYSRPGFLPASDVGLYEGWASAVLRQNRAVYTDVPIEYPPGSIPFMLAPETVSGGHHYLAAFVTMSLLLDIAGLIGTIILARRWRSSSGMWIWIVGVALLGPITYLRLDIVPAVATIWAIERASVGDSTTSGGWFGVGAIVKLYPALLIPIGIVTARRRTAFVAAAVGVVVAVLLPLVMDLGAVVHDVLGYHSARGIQVESTWGGVLFVAQRLGSDVAVVFNYGALHFAGALANKLKPVSELLSAAAVVGVTTIVWFRRSRSPQLLAEAVFVLLALELALGSVFSPQYMVWILALAATVGCIPSSSLRGLAWVVVAAAIPTQSLFPFLYGGLLQADTFPLSVLLTRNLAILVVGVVGAWFLWSGRPSDPSTAEFASRGTP
ncbi:MAG TPA: glycosyltransferase 87 family protein [Actinomycetota bacterium]|nr:glycosyltransferase 87 family protein [Actinomycetota bacterium]